MSTGITARMATGMRARIVMGMRARMATMRMRMRRKKHCKLMMDQRRMWRTQGILLESMKIGLYISDL